MLRLEVAEEMRKKREPKKDSLATEIVLVNGIQKISARNYGIFLTAERNMVNTLEFFLYPIGLKWMCGNTLSWKKF